MNRATFVIAAPRGGVCIWRPTRPPLSEAWNIASSGRAASSGELMFRITPGDGSDPVESRCR